MHRTFWIANALEFLERTAWYASKAVMVIYLVDFLGVPAHIAGTIVGVSTGLGYGLSVVGGVLVDRFGTRRTLAAALACMAIAYSALAALGVATRQSLSADHDSLPWLVPILLSMAAGVALIRPCMLDLIARSSTDLSRSVAYAFFYVLTNVGGVIGPSLALLVREDSGIEYVFLISGIMAIVLAFGALLLPADPGLLAQNRAHVTVGRIVPQVVALLRSGRYVQLLLIFSGFWIMVWQVFYSLPFYVTEVLHASRFELLETVEALVVILVSVPMAALMRRVRSLNAIVLGLIVSALSWQVIGAYRTVTGAALGLAVFALGEAVVIPRFYEYVSTLAPTGQRGTVMGFVSLPIALGSVVAGPLAGYFVEDRLEAGASGAMFSQLTLIGLATAGAMFYFGRGITLTGAGDSILDLAASGLPTTKERVAARRQSCFISYSSKDSRFVNKLHNDLSRAGVKCWFAPEDLRIGDSIRARIEAKILEYDKVLVILSKHSVTSAWVEKEVETAYELERRNATRILTPLTVDNTIFDTGIAWAADIRRTRHVGDFRGWRSATKYSGAFERLLRDLTC